MAPPPDLREFADRGFGLPPFHVGLELTINGQRCVVVRVVSQLTRPERVIVEVDALA